DCNQPRLCWWAVEKRFPTYDGAADEGSRGGDGGGGTGCCPRTQAPRGGRLDSVFLRRRTRNKCDRARGSCSSTANRTRRSQRGAGERRREKGETDDEKNAGAAVESQGHPPTGGQRQRRRVGIPPGPLGVFINISGVGEGKKEPSCQRRTRRGRRGARLLNTARG
ncbi:unnamed protein product, partial [Ectocarpus sp. 13 AM-2016]